MPISLRRALMAAGGGAIIESIQAVTVTITTSGSTGTATITAVDTARTAIFYAGARVTDEDGQDHAQARITLTNATTVTATVNTTPVTGTVTVHAYVVQFLNSGVNSVQYGTITIGSGSSNNSDTITSVDTSRAIVVYLGFSTDVTSTSNEDDAYVRIGLTNSTTVDATRVDSSANTVTVSFCVIEFNSGVVSQVQQKTNNNLGDTVVSAMVSINSADINRTMLVNNGGGATSGSIYSYRCSLASAGGVRIERNGSASGVIAVDFVAVEFASSVINSSQHITGTMASATATADSSITLVDTTKSMVLWGNAASQTALEARQMSTMALVSAEGVRVARGDGSGTPIDYAFNVVEFK